MAITITSQPAAVFPAYNPAPLVLTATNSEADVEMHLVIDGVSLTHHKREFFSLAEPLTDNFGNPITDNDGMPIPVGGDPVAVFDLGKLARNYFSNALVEVNAVENAEAYHVPSYINRRLCVAFTAEITGVSSPTFTAINAAFGVGVPEGYTLMLHNKFLTELPSLKYYVGFSDKTELSSLITTAGAISFGGTGALTAVLTVTGTGVAAAGWVTMLVGLVTGGSYDIPVYNESAGATPAQVADAMYAAMLLDGTLLGIFNITHTAGQPTINFEALVPGLVTGIGYSQGMTSGLTITTDVESTPDYLSVVNEGANRVLLTEMPVGYVVDAAYLLEGAFVAHELPISVECNPASPFYVRWVNRIGGREHWMFSRRQTDKTDIDNSVTYDPRIETNADLGRFPRQIGLTCEHTVVVGAEGIPNAEFDVLRRITTSPLIEYYDEEITEWRVVTIKGGATAKDTSLPVQSIELEFLLPSPALQF